MQNNANGVRFKQTELNVTIEHLKVNMVLLNDAHRYLLCGPAD